MATLGVTNIRFDGDELLADISSNIKFNVSLEDRLNEGFTIGEKTNPSVLTGSGTVTILRGVPDLNTATLSFSDDNNIQLVAVLVRRGEGVVEARPTSRESELISKFNDETLGDIEISVPTDDTERQQTVTEEADEASDGSKKRCEAKDVRVLVPEIDTIQNPVTREVKSYTASLTEVPTIDEGVETIVDPDGTPMWSKLTDVYFPLEWEGEDYTDVFRGFTDNSGAATAYVQFRAPPNSPTDREWQTVHYGYVKQVGSGGDTRKARAVLGDWADFCSDIAPTKLDGSSGISFEQGTTLRKIFEYVADRYNQSVNIVDDVNVQFIGSPEEFDITQRKATTGDFGFAIDNFLEDIQSPLAKLVVGSKNFKTNKDTLLDVLKWTYESAGFYWAFEGTDDPKNTEINLIVTPSPPRLSRPEGDVSIRQNNALFELQPINELKVVGDTPQSIGARADPDGSGVNLESLNINFTLESGIGISFDTETDVASDEYPVAVARYDPLYQRSGGNTLRPPRKELKVSSIEGAKKAAQAALLDEIEGTEGGRMILDGSPTLLPYDGIEVRPACNDIIDAEVTPLTYGVRRIKHVCPATERYATEVDVGLYVDPTKVSFPIAKTEVA